MATSANEEKKDIIPMTNGNDVEPELEKGEQLNLASNPTEGFGKIDDLIEDTVNAETEYTPAQFRKLRWKIDLWLLPLMWVCIFKPLSSFIL
jgi:hypothetical protein